MLNDEWKTREALNHDGINSFGILHSAFFIV